MTQVSEATKSCSACGNLKTRTDYAKRQWSARAVRRCIECVENGRSVTLCEHGRGRDCLLCDAARAAAAAAVAKARLGQAMERRIIAAVPTNWNRRTQISLKRVAAAQRVAAAFARGRAAGLNNKLTLYHESWIEKKVRSVGCVNTWAENVETQMNAHINVALGTANPSGSLDKWTAVALALPREPARRERALLRRICDVCVQSAPRTEERFAVCAGCGMRRYCSESCQVTDWNEIGHKDYCHVMSGVVFECGTAGCPSNNVDSNRFDKVYECVVCADQLCLHCERDRIHKCHDCAFMACDNCIETCRRCTKSYCDECVDGEFGMKLIRECGSCLQDCCVDCTYECSFCEQEVCTDCVRRCELCDGVFCHLCSVLDYSERWERAICLSCKEEPPAAPPPLGDVVVTNGTTLREVYGEKCYAFLKHRKGFIASAPAPRRKCAPPTAGFSSSDEEAEAPATPPDDNTGEPSSSSG